MLIMPVYEHEIFSPFLYSLIIFNMSYCFKIHTETILIYFLFSPLFLENLV